MSDAVRIGIAGLGTVGAGTVELLQRNAELLAARAGRPIEVAAVSARDKSKSRPGNYQDMQWLDDARALVQDSSLDIIVEVIGGTTIAKEIVEQALHAGKHVVTANKALIATHGQALAALAETKGVTLAFEAAVAGGIPIIGTLRDGLGANRFRRIAGILNGTGNYILTTMQKSGRDFADVLQEAQDLGYAEADPSFDIDGIDTAHKLAILAALAFGAPVNLAAISIEGIRHITRQDMRYAAELGYTIKLLGIAEMSDAGLRQRVHPALVKADAPIARIDGAFNAIHLEGDAVGRIMLEGAGAGAGPTASSVVADIVQIVRGTSYAPFTVPTAQMQQATHASLDSHHGGYYIRLTVHDKPGVLADITAIFAKENISVQSLIQHGHSDNSPAQIVIITHETGEAAMQKALGQIAALATMIEPPHIIRIEPL